MTTLTIAWIPQRLLMLPVAIAVLAYSSLFSGVPSTVSGWQAGGQWEGMAVEPAALEPSQPQTGFPATDRSWSTETSKLGRRLYNLNWQQFEEELAALWGHHLTATAMNDAASLVRVTIPGNRPQPNEMLIDRLQNTVTFVGHADDALTWSELIDLIDVHPSQRQGQYQLVAMGNATADDVRRAITAAGIQEVRHQSLKSVVQEYSNNHSTQNGVMQGDLRGQGVLSPAQTATRPIATQTASSGVSGMQTSFSTTEPETPGTTSTARLRPLMPQQETGSPTTTPQQDETPQDQRPNRIVELDDQTLSGNVRIRIIDEFGTIAIIGAPQDTARVRAMLEQLMLAAETSKPGVDIIPVKNADAGSLKTIIDEIYESMYQSQNGQVSVTSLDDRRSLLVIGTPQGLNVVRELVSSLDIVTPDEAMKSDFEVFLLEHTSAIDAAQKLRAYFSTGDPENDETLQPEQWIASLQGPVAIIIGYRSNSVIVKGNSEVLRRAAQFIAEIDVNEIRAKNVVKTFQVRNALASNLATVLQNAINGNLENAPQVFAPGNQNANFQQNQAFNNQQALARARAALLEIVAIDGEERVASGILFDVQVTANDSANQLVVIGPEESMPLIAELVRQLDVMPDAQTQIKVFQMMHGDANDLLTMLQTLFGQNQAQGGFNQNQFNSNNLPLQSSGATSGSTLVNLRFGIEPRTNSIIASGPAGDLQVVEDLLYRLDEADLDNRITDVYWVKNLPAEDLANALNSLLEARQEVIDADPITLNPYESARRSVVVVPEVVSNRLLISATPQFYDEVLRLIAKLDSQPPMVVVKVLIAEIQLDSLTEYGVEFGIQDSLLFDRGIGTVGFPFNQASIGNNNNALSLGTRELLAGQGLSNLNIGRTNADLGYGGLVLSAGNESINVLLRALENRGLARVLSSPTVMTLENLQGRIQVGANVPRITSAQANNNAGGGITTDVEDVAVGVILEITPRVNPDGMIVMTVDAVNSSLGSEAQGIPVFVADGQVIRSPPINITQAQTTIMARSGQTVAFSGLIQDSTVREHRGTPILSDLPGIGPLFSFESEQHQRSELLIILTPYLVRNEADIDMLNQVEMDRMHWCLADIAEIYGSIGYGGTVPTQSTPVTYYPDSDPNGLNPQYVPLDQSFDQAVPMEPMNPATEGTFPMEVQPSQAPGGFSPDR